MKRVVFLLLFSLPLFAQRLVVVHSVFSSPGAISIINANPPFSQRNGISPHGATLNKVIYNGGYLYTVSSGNGKIYILADSNLPFVVDSIDVGFLSNPYSADVGGGKIFVSLWMYDSIASYDLATKGKVWSVGVWKSPQYVGLHNGYLFAISTGYDRSSYTTDTSRIYKIDTSTGGVVDSINLGINLLSMEFLNGDTAAVSGGDWFDATTNKIYIIKTNPLSVIDSISTPANIGFLKKISPDTLVALGYYWAGLFIVSSRAFVPIPFGSYSGFSEAEVYGSRVFILAAGDYTSNGNVLVFNTSTNSIEHVATVDIGPISITLSPRTLSVKEVVSRRNNLPEGVYSIDGRRVNSISGSGVYFILRRDKIRRVIVR